MFISFLFLSEERRKKRNQRKKKETGGRRAPAGKHGNILRKQDIRGDTHLCSHKLDSVTKITRVTHSVCSDFGYIKYCRVATATHQVRKLSVKKGISLFVSEMMYALFERGSTDSFRRKHPIILLRRCLHGVGVIEVFAELFSKKRPYLLFYRPRGCSRRHRKRRNLQGDRER